MSGLRKINSSLYKCIDYTVTNTQMITDSFISASGHVGRHAALSEDVDLK